MKIKKNIIRFQHILAAATHRAIFSMFYLLFGCTVTANKFLIAAYSMNPASAYINDQPDAYKDAALVVKRWKAMLAYWDDY